MAAENDVQLGLKLSGGTVCMLIKEGGWLCPSCSALRHVCSISGAYA